MKKIKVMHILNTGIYSGAENVVISIINGLSYDYECVYVSLNGSIKNVLNENKIKYYPVKKLTIWNIKKAIHELKPDIIHAHDFTAGIIATLSTTSIPIINHLHNNPPWIKKYSIKSVVYGLSTLRYTKILTVSNSVMDEFVLGEICKKKTLVIDNPIKVEYIRSEAQKANIKDESDIIFVGRLSEQKNPILFLEIVKELKRFYPTIKAIMVGDGEMRGEVKDCVKFLELEDNVKILGFVDNPYGLINNSHIMIMPSKWEGFGLAAIEALSLGIPVVASQVGGLKNIIDNKCGNLCIEKIEYIEAAKKLLSNNELLEYKSRNAYNRANELNNYDAYINIINRIYRDSL